MRATLASALAREPTLFRTDRPPSPSNRLGSNEWTRSP